jgi:hypothetical protein
LWPESDVQAACSLSAPTGCASFQMKHGATTCHRTYGVPVGHCGPTKGKEGKAYLRRLERFKLSIVHILDEFSMIGRQMLGKICFRVNEMVGPDGPPEFGGKVVSLGGRDVVLAGDPKQAPPIGDEAMYKNGPYSGRGLNKPKSGSPEGA